MYSCRCWLRGESRREGVSQAKGLKKYGRASGISPKLIFLLVACCPGRFKSEGLWIYNLQGPTFEQPPGRSVLRGEVSVIVVCCHLDPAESDLACFLTLRAERPK